MLKFFQPSAATSLAERTRRRVSLHLIPYLFFLYILAFLDRANVSVAALGMERAPSEGGLGFDKTMIGFGFGIFFWGYWILEIPSTLSVVKWGARWVFVRILILWGLSCALIGTIGTPVGDKLFAWLPVIPEDAGVIGAVDQSLDFLLGWAAQLCGFDGPLTWFEQLAHFFNGLPHEPVNQFYFYRFMLGFFEGGFFPSVIVYLSLWFRAEDRAKAIASFMSAIPLSLVIGSPLSGALLGINWFGVQGWRWIFLLQGAVPILAGFATLFFLPDRPEKAAWLPPDEKDWLVGVLQKEHQARQSSGHGLWVKHLGVVLLLTTVYLCLVTVNYGVVTFLPAIIKARFGVSDVWASVLTALPYLAALMAMLVNGWHSDRTGERIWHAVLPLTGLSLGLALAALFDGAGAVSALLLILVVGMFLFAHLPAYWPLPSMWLGPLTAASATGFINMVGNLGGFIGPVVVGKTAESQASFAPALLKLAPLPLVGAALLLLVGYTRKRRRAHSTLPMSKED